MEARSCRPGANWVHVCRVNVIEGEPNDRQMTTGNHTVRDIYCCKCGTILGWKYVSIAIRFHFRFSAHGTPSFWFAGQGVRTIPKVQRREVHFGAQPPRRCAIAGSNAACAQPAAPLAVHTSAFLATTLLTSL